MDNSKHISELNDYCEKLKCKNIYCGVMTLYLCLGGSWFKSHRLQSDFAIGPL